MILASMAASQLSVFAFDSYTYPNPSINYVGSFIGQVFSQQVSQLPFFGYIYTKKIFPIAMMVIVIIQGLFSIIRMIILRNKNKK